MNMSPPMMLLADVTRTGDGYTVKPKKPIAEVSAVEAARILNVHRSQLGNLINYPLGQKLLKWRWTSERKGKRAFDLQSVLEYRRALEDPEVKHSV